MEKFDPEMELDKVLSRRLTVQKKLEKREKEVPESLKGKMNELESKEFYCPYCATKLISENSFCTFCGVPMDKKTKAEIKIVSQKDKWSDLRAEVKKLKEKYAKLTEVKKDLQRARDALEQKREESLQVIVDGFPLIDLSSFEEAVKNEKVRVKAQESLVRIAEKAAKRRFPERFDFL